MPVADDEFPLPAADGNHAVHRQDAGFKRALYRRAVNDARRAVFNPARFDGGKRHPVQRAAERIYNAADDGVPNANIRNLSRAACNGAGGNERIRVEQRCADGILGKIERETVYIVIKLLNFAIPTAGKTVNGDDVILCALYYAVTVNGGLKPVLPHLFMQECA